MNTQFFKSHESRSWHVVRSINDDYMIVDAPCGAWHNKSMCRVVDCIPADEVRRICRDCVKHILKATGRRYYIPPTLTKGISPSKKAKLRPQIRAWRDRQALKRWNDAAQR